jgi:hypothetical protein
MISRHRLAIIVIDDDRGALVPASHQVHLIDGKVPDLLELTRGTDEAWTDDAAALGGLAVARQAGGGLMYS